MIEKKKVLRNSMRIAILFLFMMISVFSFNVYADENASLSQDDKGNYLIKTEQDYYKDILLHILQKKPKKILLYFLFA